MPYSASQHPLVRLASKTINTTARVNLKLASKMAYRLFTVPQSSGVSETGTRFLASAKWETLQAGSESVQVYRWLGTGPTVLLAHGWESNSARWGALVKALQQADYSIIALDAPAHGNSGGASFNAIHYAGFIDAVAVRYPLDYAVGHSAGGMALVYWLTQLQPDHPLRKLVLLATPDSLTDLIDLFARIVDLDERVIGGVHALIEEQFEWTVDYYSTARFAASLTLPGLIVHDRGDDVAAYSCAEAIHAAWPASQFITTRGKGHTLFDREVVMTVVDYLADGSDVDSL